MNLIGLIYLEGIGVTKNRSEAVKWAQKAARLGNTTAQNNLKDMGETW